MKIRPRSVSSFCTGKIFHINLADDQGYLNSPKERSPPASVVETGLESGDQIATVRRVMRGGRSQ